MPADALLSTLEQRLELLYPNSAAKVAISIRSLVAEYASSESFACAESHWSERDAILITYADQIRSADLVPLATLRDWLHTTGLDELLPIVHLLPFCPYSSDDGFSVIDYLEVDPDTGEWDDIAQLGEHVDLMFDLVLNHISRESEWFQKYLVGEAPYDKFFIEVDTAVDLSSVVRPRSLPLLTAVETSRGTQHVWTTFSDDQIDLNYAEPELLLRMLRVLLEYAKRGARIVRLDAVAFLWKELGTNCLHLAQTHEVIKLMREVVADAFPRTILLTETNVPHDENVSYFGAGDEAHLVYQFALPPLLLDAFIHGDAVYFRHWLENLDSPPNGCTFLNFTASHDGIGVRPLEGLLPDNRFDGVIEAARARGGLINTRRSADGNDIPYEINITYVDALSPTIENELPNDELHARRFLASQAVMLALPGIPAVYLHSLVGTRNDKAGVKSSGLSRRINRHKYELIELDSHLVDAESLAGRIHQGYRRMLEVRRQHTAFHPDARLRLLEGFTDTMLAFDRVSLDGNERIVIVANFGDQQAIELSQLDGPSGGRFRDLLAGDGTQFHDGLFTLPAGDCAWLLGE
ncbi:MAG: alpha-amylase family glycosyl hydrolase [Aeoliella sp.]